MISGGVVPGGIVRRRVWLIAVTSASAAPMLASGWKKTRISPTPAIDCDSMCSMLLTVVVIARSEMVTMRPSTSFGDSPLNCQMTEMTGMLISGKMSTGVRAIVRTPPMAISIAITMKVYGRRSARRTINIVVPGGVVRRSTEGTLVSQRENLGRELFTVNFDSGQKLVLFAHEIEPVSDDLAA